MKKNKILIYIGLILLTSMATYLIVDEGFIFGSKTDWINQHTIFPEYFRNLFYETKKIIPNFATHIGAGQNIFHFSYYGLLNPMILLSYLAPKIEMTTYIIGANIFLFVLSSLLLYYFLEKHTNSEYHAFLATIILIFSSSFLFHFHRHFMFVSYMPFLILGLLGIDQYFEKEKKTLLTISTFLMIMTSYYYSIIGIVIFLIYGTYCYLEKKKEKRKKEVLKDAIKFIFPIGIAILMAGILLLPTAHAILSGRGSSEQVFSLKELLLPKLNIEATLYDTYSLGLTSISLIALVYASMKKEKRIRTLSIIILAIMIFPFFIYLLNGGLYIRNKVFIPFLPLIGIILVNFLDDLFQNHIKLKPLMVVFGVLSLLSLFSIHKTPLFFFYLDILMTFIILIIYQKTKKRLVMILPILLIVLTNWFIGQKTDMFIPKEFLQEVFSTKKEERLKKQLEKEPYMVRSADLDSTLYTVNKIISPKHYTTSIYSSTYHKDYQSFQRNIFKNPLPNRNKLILAQSNNILFQTFMGIKYISYSGEPAIGYQPVTQNKKRKIYQNDNVLPIAYATSNIISQKDFESLSYPENERALIGNVVVTNKKTNISLEQKSKEIFPFYHLPSSTKNLKIRKKKEKYIIDAKEDTRISIPLNQMIENQILFITFDVENQTSCDAPTQKIGINGIYNKKSCIDSEYQNDNNTFHYVLSKNKPWNKLSILVGEGHYVIKNIKTYLLNYQEITTKVKNLDTWKIKTNNSDTLEGTIEVHQNGYFATSIPYDEGFKIYVDGKEQNYEKVNTAFIGFPIKKGAHSIKMVYQSPLLKEGIIISIIGLCGLVIIIVQDLKRTSRKKE